MLLQSKNKMEVLSTYKIIECLNRKNNYVRRKGDERIVVYVIMLNYCKDCV